MKHKLQGVPRNLSLDEACHDIYICWSDLWWRWMWPKRRKQVVILPDHQKNAGLLPLGGVWCRFLIRFRFNGSILSCSAWRFVRFWQGLLRWGLNRLRLRRCWWLQATVSVFRCCYYGRTIGILRKNPRHRTDLLEVRFASLRFSAIDRKTWHL